MLAWQLSQPRARSKVKMDSEEQEALTVYTGLLFALMLGWLIVQALVG